MQSHAMRVAAVPLKSCLSLIRFNRPIGTFLLLWPTWWALWLAASGPPSPKNLFVFTVGVFLMRSAGCALNDVVDRNIDGSVARTQERPLPSGQISPKVALSISLAFGLAAFLLVLLTNRLTILLSFVAVVLTAIYPFMKRITHLPQLALGAAFSWGVPMAYAAETGTIDARIWLLFCASFVWTVVYDTFYAMVDRNDDLRIGVKSTAILFGNADRLITAALQLLVLLLLVLCGRQFELGRFFYFGLATGTCFFIYQQWLIRERDRKACFQAFLNYNLFGMAVFAGLAADFRFS